LADGQPIEPFCGAIDLGFLVNNESRRGKPFRLVLKGSVDAAITSLLPDPKTILTHEGAT
jgi:hypothetical protein